MVLKVIALVLWLIAGPIIMVGSAIQGNGVSIPQYCGVWLMLIMEMTGALLRDYNKRR